MRDFRNQSKPRRWIRPGRLPDVFGPKRLTQKLVRPSGYRLGSVRLKTKPFFARPSIAWPLVRRVVILGSVAFILYLFILSPVFKVSEIVVENSNFIPSELIAGRLPRGKNIFLVNGRRIERDLLATFPVISKAVVFRGLPNTIKVLISEKDSNLTLIAGAKHYKLDETGAIYKVAEDDEPESRLVVDFREREFSLGQSVVDRATVEFIDETFSRYPTVVGGPILRAEIYDSPYDIDFITDRAIKIRLDTTRPLEDQLLGLKRIFDLAEGQIKKYVDLRVEGWGYYL